MNDQEREELADDFYNIAEELNVLYDKLSTLAKKYPGLNKDSMFSHSIGGTLDAAENTSSLAEYIRSATGEDWTKQ